MSINLIIFDLDGTLVDSSGDITDAINHALEPFGVGPITVQETIGLVGEGLSRLVEKVIEKEKVRADKGRLIDRFVEFYSTHLVDKTTVYPGVKETLEHLGVYRKAVISNKRETLSEDILAKLGLSRYLDIIVGSDSTPERKPSPVPIRYVLEKLGVGPERAMIVGDSNYDIEAGKAAGITTVAVTYGYRPVDILQGADFIINSMSELVTVLAKMNS